MVATESATAQFSVGDLVDVRKHGRATIIEPLQLDPAAANFGRYRIRYHEDGTTYYLGPTRLRKMYPTNKAVLVTRHTHAYRDAIVHNVDRPDVCLEIGCHEGITTHIISNRASFVAGVDSAAKVVEVAQRRFPQLCMQEVDGLDVAATAALSPTGTYSRICIDISGKAPLELVCRMIRAQRAAFPDAALIVKNQQLHDALLRMEAEAAAAADSAAGSQAAVAAAHAVPPSPGPGHTSSSTEHVGGAGAPAAASAGAAAVGAAAPSPPGAAAPSPPGAAARLAALLGEACLREVEVFRHQARLPRTRPPRAPGGGGGGGGSGSGGSRRQSGSSSGSGGEGAGAER